MHFSRSCCTESQWRCSSGPVRSVLDRAFAAHASRRFTWADCWNVGARNGDQESVKRRVTFWLIQLAVAALLFLVGWTLRGDNGLQTAANIAQLLSLILAIPPVVMLFWPSRRRHLGTRDAADALAVAVAEQWRAEALVRMLDDPDPIPVWWHTTKRPITDHLENIGSALSARADDAESFVRGFRGLRRSRLVILGDAGTGKTTLAVQLVRELIIIRTPDEPVPVLLSAASWDATRYPDLMSWIATRLRQHYPALGAAEFGPNAPERLVAERRILPVLDGLDEMRTPARLAALRAINRSLAGDDQLVITCRTDEYVATVARAGDVLHSAMVIEPEPLASDAAVDYLRRCLPPISGHTWDALQAATRHLTTALDLWMVRIVYFRPGVDSMPLTRFRDGNALRNHLLDRLIPTMIETRPRTRNRREPFRPLHTWDPNDVRLWLSTIARGLVDAGTPDFAWWRLARQTGTLTKFRGIAWGVTAGLGAAISGMFLFGLWVTAMSDLGTGTRWVSSVGLLYTVPFGIVCGAVIGYTIPSWIHQLPGFADFHARRQSVAPSKETLRRWPVIVALADLSIGLLTGSSVRFSVYGALLVGIATWLVIHLIALIESPARTHAAVTPHSTFLADRRLTLVRFAAGAVLLGLALTGGGPALLPAMIPLGGLLGMAVGRHHAWLAYRLAVRNLAARAVLPRNLMAFLNDAHRLGLVRAVGPLYQFRHLALRDHLASGAPGKPTTPAATRRRDTTDPPQEESSVVT